MNDINSTYAKWYFDTGEGYSEKNSLEEEIGLKDDLEWLRLEFSIAVPSDCRRIRFDPCNRVCAVWGMSFTSSKMKAIKSVIGDSIDLHEATLFLHDDPQYEINVASLRGETISVSYRLHVIKENFLVERFNHYIAQNAGRLKKKKRALPFSGAKNGKRGAAPKEENDTAGKLLSEEAKLLDYINTAPEDFGKFVEYREHRIDISPIDTKLIAFYLPQYHEIPENNLWWGRGFTEWSNVTKSTPRFVGHYQPQLPIDVGFYDLRHIDPMVRQVELAKNYGLYGFCFHYYWFSGKRLLERPLENYLSNPDALNFPFCVCWANENWSRRWDGSDHEILIAQRHSEEDDKACIADIARFFADDRYIRVDGKPLVIIYKGELLDDCKETIRIWREYCALHGVGDIHLVGAFTGDKDTLLGYGFDKLIEFPPHDLIFKLKADVLESSLMVDNTKHYLYDMHDFQRNIDDFVAAEEDVYKGLFPSWDNSPRRANYASIFQTSPEIYRLWLEKSISATVKTQPPGDRLVFINAWNEWAEGAHLEPDMRYGYAYLEETAQAILASLQIDKAVTGAKTYKD